LEREIAWDLINKKISNRINIIAKKSSVEEEKKKEALAFEMEKAEDEAESEPAPKKNDKKEK